LRARGYRPLAEVIVQNLDPLVGQRTLVQRWWNANPSEPRDAINIVAGGSENEDGRWRMEDGKGGTSPSSILDPPSSFSSPRVFASTAVLGLTPGESKLSKIADVIGPEKFARLERGERQIVYMSGSIAETLKVREGDTVRVGGIPLHVAGIFDAEAFDRDVKTLSGDPLAPLKYAAGALDADGRALSDVSAAEAFAMDAGGAGAEVGATYEHLSSSNFVIVPGDISRMLPNAAL